MKSVVRWTGGRTMEGETESGKVTPIYSDTAPSPMEMALQAHAACSLVDLRVGLKERMENVRKMWVDVEGCLLYTSPSPRDQRGSRMPSSA